MREGVRGIGLNDFNFGIVRFWLTALFPNLIICMMITAFKIFIVAFIASLLFLLVALVINMGFANPIFNSQYDSSPYIEQTRAIINVFDKYDRLDAWVAFISACSSAITGFILKVRGQFNS